MAAQPGPDRRAFLMVWDGLRPDMITERNTPNLYRMAQEGVRFADSHAVYPTVTRCNSASISTGALPASHGIPGNSFYAPALDPDRALSTSDIDALYALRDAREGLLLARETMGDVIAREWAGPRRGGWTHGRTTAGPRGGGWTHGKGNGRAAVVSTGSTGSAFLQHPRVRECGDHLLLHPAFWCGATREELESRLGPMPAGSLPNTEQNVWFTRAISEFLLPEIGPRLITFWHTDPDRTQHDRGIGHPETLRSIGDADANLGRVLAALDALGLRDRTDVVVTSDHGFSTIVGTLDVAGALVEAGLKQSRTSTDIVVTGGAIYLQDASPESVARVAAALWELPGMGPVFSGVRGAPVVAGTLPIPALGIGGDLAPDLLYSPDWSDATNEHGVAGSAWSDPTSKAATHGSISPWDVRNSLVAAGPGFKRGLVSEVPAGNVDIAPTLLHLLGLPHPEGQDGRVLHEALAAGPDPADVPVEREVLSAEAAGMRRLVQLSTVDDRRYVDFGWVER